ncbi:MAG: hypothetical protein ACFFEO_15150 [Candidatus Thorarchaeota archaeon]
MPPKKVGRDIYGDASKGSRFVYGCIATIIIGIIAFLILIFIYLPGYLAVI